MPNKRQMFRPRQCRMTTGSFIGPDGQKIRAYCNTWSCPDCGPAKKRKFLWQMSVATGLIQQGGKRWRAITLTLSRNDGDHNEIMGWYWNRFRNSMKKAGYDMKHFIWVKEYQPGTGMLHLHILIAAFIPWGVIKHYWILAVGSKPGRDYRHTWISAAQVRSTAAYMAKYMSEDLDNSLFRKGERRYGMSRNMRDYWPRDEHTSTGWKYSYDPDNSYLMQRAADHLADLRDIRRSCKGWDKRDLYPDFSGDHKKRMKFLAYIGEL